MINKFFNWLLISSENPSQGALLMKGLTSLGVVQLLFSTVLPSLGVHVAWDLSSVGDSLYNITFALLTAISAGVALVGGVRKLWNTFALPHT